MRISDGHFVWISEAYRGPVHDSRIAREGGVLSILTPDEVVIADKGYEGIERIRSPVKGKDLTPVERMYNKTLNQKRVIGERAFGRLKEFGCLKQPWRSSLDKQDKVFIVCAAITNEKLKKNPL